MISYDDLVKAEDWTIFRGPACFPSEETKLSEDDWDLFAVSGYSELGDDVLSELSRQGVQLVGDHFHFNPQVDGERTEGREPRVDDFHAAIAYLNEGGTLIKVPDALKSPHYRYYAIARAKGRGVGYCLPVEHCVYCSERTEGSYYIHEFRNMTGKEVPLCNACGSKERPSCDAIWTKLEIERNQSMGKKDLFGEPPNFDRMDKMLRGTADDNKRLKQQVLRCFGDEKAHFDNEEDFNDRFEALRRLLPTPLANEPIVIAGYLEKMLLNPGHDGFILVDAWRTRFEGKK